MQLLKRHNKHIWQGKIRYHKLFSQACDIRLNNCNIWFFQVEYVLSSILFLESILPYLYLRKNREFFAEEMQWFYMWNITNTRTLGFIFRRLVSRLFFFFFSNLSGKQHFCCFLITKLGFCSEFFQFCFLCIICSIILLSYMFSGIL